MTKACFFRQDGRVSGFEISGHAGYAQSGSDIVCSAISTAVHMTVLGLTEVLGLRSKVSCDEETGTVRLLLDGQAIEQAQVWLITLEKELVEIHKQYPDNIRIIDRERREFKCFS